MDAGQLIERVRVTNPSMYRHAQAVLASMPHAAVLATTAYAAPEVLLAKTMLKARIGVEE